MFKFKTINPTDLQKIYALKEQINQPDKINKFAAAGETTTDLVMPHDSYFVGLSSLKSFEKPKPEVTGIQVIDTSEGSFKSIINLYSNVASDKQFHMLNDKKYLKSYEQAFNKILDLDVDEKDYEVRSIKIPALHVEALWLHKESDENADLFTPIRSIGLFKENKTYDKEDFFNILKDAAANYDLTDDSIGG